MKAETPSDILPTIRVLYYLSNLVGLAPFTFARERTPAGRNRKQCISPSRYGRLYTSLILMIVTVGTLVMTAWRILYSYPRIRAVTILITDLAILLVTYLNTTASLVKCATGHEHAFSGVVSSIPHVDGRLLYQFEDAWQHTNIFQASQFIYFVLYEVVLYCFQYTVWANEHGSKNRNHIPVSCVIHAVICVMEIQYFNLVVILKRRFYVLNSRIDSITRKIQNNRIICRTPAADKIPERQFKIAVINNPDDAIFARKYSAKEFRQLYRLRCVNDVLSDMVSSVNSTYGLQILLSITMAFMSVTTCLYFGIDFAMRLQEDEGDQGKHQYALILCLIWAAVGTFRTVMITSSCNAVSGEAGRTSVLLHKLLLVPSLRPDTLTEVQLFLHQAASRPTKFTASDFFTVSHSTLCSFIGAVTTYLVILLQFRN